jgi:methylglyoxal synthase
MENITRLEIINHANNNHAIGRLLSLYKSRGDFENIELSVQDEGRTLKVFISGDENKSKKENTDKYIALIAHDGKKPEMVSLVMNNIETLNLHKLIGTGTTGRLVKESANLNIELLNSGPRGGDAQIATMAIENKLKAVIFLVDPLDVHPHQVDVSMLLRICNVYNIPLATNSSTAILLLKELSEVDGEKQIK